MGLSPKYNSLVKHFEPQSYTIFPTSQKKSAYAPQRRSGSAVNVWHPGYFPDEKDRFYYCLKIGYVAFYSLKHYSLMAQAENAMHGIA